MEGGPLKVWVVAVKCRAKKRTLFALGCELLQVKHTIVVELLKGIFPEVPVIEVIRNIAITGVDEPFNDCRAAPLAGDFVLLGIEHLRISAANLLEGLHNHVNPVDV